LTFTFVDYAVLHISLFTMHEMKITHSLYHHLISRAHIALLIIVSIIRCLFISWAQASQQFFPTIHTNTCPSMMNLEGEKSLRYAAVSIGNFLKLAL